MKHLSLSRCSMDTLRALLLALTSLCAGCGDEPAPPLPEPTTEPSPPGPPDASLFDRPLCEADGRISTHRLNPSKPYDYYELQWAGNKSDWSIQYQILEGTGVKCKTASDVNKCNDAFSLLKGKQSDGFRLYLYFSQVHWYYFATTVGATVALNTNLLEFLGEIDTPQEAALVLWAHFYGMACDDAQYGGVRKVADGYEVIALYGQRWSNKTYRALFLVRPDGTFTEQWREVIHE